MTCHKIILPDKHQPSGSRPQRCLNPLAKMAHRNRLVSCQVHHFQRPHSRCNQLTHRKWLSLQSRTNSLSSLFCCLVVVISACPLTNSKDFKSFCGIKSDAKLEERKSCVSASVDKTQNLD